MSSTPIQEVIERLTCADMVSRPVFDPADVRVLLVIHDRLVEELKQAIEDLVAIVDSRWSQMECSGEYFVEDYRALLKEIGQ